MMLLTRCSLFIAYISSILTFRWCGLPRWSQYDLCQSKTYRIRVNIYISFHPSIIAIIPVLISFELIVVSSSAFIVNHHCRGSGTVYSGRDSRYGDYNAIVAIKKMVLSRQAKYDVVINEILIMKEMRHQNIVNFLDSWLQKGTLWVSLYLYLYLSIDNDLVCSVTQLYVITCIRYI